MAGQQGTDEIYKTLEGEIIELKILPGEVLSENQLCKRFGVSRTPIRSVLQRLEQNRFVQIIHHRGTVETMVLRDFVRTSTPIQVEQIRYALQLVQQEGEARADLEHFDINHFLKVDLAMHALWFQFTGKEFLWQVLTKPQADYARLIRLDIVGGKNVADVLDDHREFMRIIDEKDVEAIEPMMTHHLYGGVRRLSGSIFSPEYRDFFRQEDS